MRSRLDLYSILDKPRARLAKYPLLVRNILKWTENEHGDIIPLQEAVRKFEELLQIVDKLTGDAQLALVKKQLANSESDPVIHQADRLIFDGPLRTAKGVKLQAFLFDSGLVLTKPMTTTSQQPCYRLFIPGLPAECLAVEDIQLPPHFTYKISSTSSSKPTRTGSSSSLLRDIFGSNSSKETKESSSSSSAPPNSCQSMFRVFLRSELANSEKTFELCRRFPERVALLAHDDHNKRAWLDKLTTVASLWLTTF